MELKEITTHRPSSFHGDTIKTTPDKLMRLWDAAGIEYYSGNDGEGKTNYDFGGQIQDIPFFVYDWKEYRVCAIHESLKFHIGAENQTKSRWAVKLLEELLTNY